MHSIYINNVGISTLFGMQFIRSMRLSDRHEAPWPHLLQHNTLSV